MSCCEDKNPKYNCGERISSNCVFYNKEVPEFSDLHDEKCLTISETTEDIYNLLKQLKESLDTEELEDGCLKYDKTKIDDKNTILVKTVLKKHEEEICKLNDKKNDDGNSNTPSNGNNKYDLRCLISDPCCQTNPNNIIQLLINKLCNLEERISNIEKISL